MAKHPVTLKECDDKPDEWYTTWLKCSSCGYNQVNTGLWLDGKSHLAVDIQYCGNCGGRVVEIIRQENER